MLTRISPRPEYLYVLFLLVAIAVYAFSLDNSFRDDDFLFILSSEELDDPADPFRASSRHAFYRPGALILFWVEYSLFGLELSGAYLAVNLVIHILNSLCIIRMLRALEIDRRSAYLAGGLFVLGFGQYGKQVMWASAGGPMVAILLVVCASRLIADYQRAMISGVRKRWMSLVGAGILMMVAPSFHEIGLIASLLTVALLLLYRGIGKPGRLRDRILLPLAPAITAIASWAVIYASILSEHDVYARAADSLVKAPMLLFRHLGFMILPVKQSTLLEGQSWPFRFMLTVSAHLQGAIAVAIIAVSIYLLIRGDRALKFLVFWFYLAIVPFCLVDIPEDWLELRYIYCGAMPACALIAIALSELLLARGGWRRWVGIAITTLVAGMTIFVTVILESKYDSQGKDESNREKMEIIRRNIGL